MKCAASTHFRTSPTPSSIAQAKGISACLLCAASIEIQNTVNHVANFHTPPTRPVALVTGAARRLGREIALDLARHGFDVAVHCRHSLVEAEATVAELQALGAKAHIFAADLSDEAACRALVPAVVAHFKRLDAIVNNASTFEYDAPGSFSYAAMDLHLRANTGPAVLLAQALFDHLKGCARLGEIDMGCVVNLVDQKLWNLNPDYFSYTLSKAALEAATVMLAQALAPQVRVCGVAPGVTLVSGPMSEQEFEKAHALTPLHRSSTPQDIARTVRFLIESPAITGTTLMVDGGQHLMAQGRDVMFIANPNKVVSKNH
jgi:NAD(P)-dependent dehydrogenase (short-subunit alcohol dehydrogenase family)